MPRNNIKILEEQARTWVNLTQVQMFLSWDQQVMMPKKGGRPRSKQKSALSKVQHQILENQQLLKALNNIKKEELDEKTRADYREIKKEAEKAKKVPLQLKKKISEKQSETIETWKKAKKEQNFQKVKQDLKEMVELKRKYAKQVNPEEESYKILFNEFEPFLDLEKMEKMLYKLKPVLKNLLDKIHEQENTIETGALNGQYSKKKQRKLVEKIVTDIGYEWEKGRLDETEHPFTVGNPFDSRITTRYPREELSQTIRATVHECGHSLYILGLPSEDYGRPVGQARELGIHESQSRLWENHIAKSKEFQKYLLPLLKNYFPKKFQNTTEKQLYESLNKVKTRNPIRTNADEVTYHLHILLRYELEKKLINGKIEVEDLPELWNKKSKEYLNVKPKNQAEGILQDIHWYTGNFGYFPTYTLGSIISAQLYQKIQEDTNKNIEELKKNGEFKPILEWLRKNIHQHGKKYKTEELVEKATEEKPDPEHFIKYIKEKYNDLYNL